MTTPGTGDAAHAGEHHIQVPRTARYWTLTPDGPVRERWIVLHGYKQLARRFLRRFEGLEEQGVAVVAPEALSRFYVSPEPGRHGPESVVGATWMTREDRLAEIADYVGYLDRVAAEVGGDGVPLTVLGFSQGVATAARWVTLGAVRPARMVLWGDTAPPDLDVARAAEALRDVDLVLVRGTEDRAVSPVRAREEAQRLDAAGIAYSVRSYPGGHDIHRGTVEELVGAAGP